MCLENPEIRGKSNKLIRLAAMITNGKLFKKPMNFLCPRPPRIMDSVYFHLPNSCGFFSLVNPKPYSDGGTSLKTGNTTHTLLAIYSVLLFSLLL